MWDDKIKRAEEFAQLLWSKIAYKKTLYLAVHGVFVKTVKESRNKFHTEKSEYVDYYKLEGVLMFDPEHGNNDIALLYNGLTTTRLSVYNFASISKIDIMEKCPEFEEHLKSLNKSLSGERTN